MVVQDHRGVKRVTRPILEFKSCEAAQCPLGGVELMDRLKTRQMVIAEGAKALTPAEQCYALAATSPDQQGPRCPR